MMDHFLVFLLLTYAYFLRDSYLRPRFPTYRAHTLYKQNSILLYEIKLTFFLEILSIYFPLLFIYSLATRVPPTWHRIFPEHNNAPTTEILSVVEMPKLWLILFRLRVRIY